MKKVEFIPDLALETVEVHCTLTEWLMTPRVSSVAKLWLEFILEPLDAVTEMLQLGGKGYVLK